MNKTRKDQEQHFLNLYLKHKGTPMAVSSESWNHKMLRFQKICEILQNKKNVTVHDVGMGIGDLGKFISDQFTSSNIMYSGTEIVQEYVDEAKKRFPDLMFYQRDIAEKAFEDKYDFVLLSGVFHQKRNATIPEWEDFYQSILVNSFQMCKKGLSFNFISPFVDFYQPEVYYCNLNKLQQFINDKLSRFFEIKHNYALFEFTVHVYQPNYINELYPQDEFQKYFKNK